MSRVAFARALFLSLLLCAVSGYSKDGAPPVTPGQPLQQVISICQGGILAVLPTIALTGKRVGISNGTPV